MHSDCAKALLDCEEGRRLGCGTFCCRLIVRLTTEERARGCAGVTAPRGCVPKDPDGWCVHLDRQTCRCRIWSARPQVCREYDCNQDPLLAAALCSGSHSLVGLALGARALGAGGQVVVRRLA